MSLVFSLVVAVSSFVSPLAPERVAADNGLTITKSVDGNPLIGGPTTYTITVRNDSFAAGTQNPDGKAYNLDITDILPPGVLFTSAADAAGTATSPTITTVQTGVVPNQIPQQTVKFTNLTDIARNQTFTMTLAATLNPNVKTPGTALSNNASAAVSNDPRKPASDGTAGVSAGNATANSTALPFKLTKKAVQSTGVSQDTGGCPTAMNPPVGAGRVYSYDLIAENNTLGPSTNMIITDTLPDGIDYCADQDTGTIKPAVTLNGDGTTTLVYNLGTLAVGEKKTVSPPVAIRYTYRSNGALVPDDTLLTNTAHMTGTYSGDGVQYDTGNQTAQVKAKYATIAKGASESTVTYGDTITYSLTPSTSTNYDISNEYVIDTIPNGQEYNAGSATLGGGAFAPTDNAAADGIYTACAGTHPSPGVYVCNDGTTVLTWGPVSKTGAMPNPLAPTTAGTQYTISYTVTQDRKYGHNTGAAILATDSFTNSADVVYDAASIAGHSAQPNSVTRHKDTAMASEGTKPPTIAKIVTAVTRADGGVTEGKVSDPKNSTAAVGDITTFQVTYTGSTNADQGSIVVSDFLPTNYRYVANSAQYSGTYTGMVTQDCVPDCNTNGAIVRFTLLGDSDLNVKATKINDTFVVTLKAQSLGGNAGDGNTNLAKFSGLNTAGLAYSGRDQTATTTLAPHLEITKTNNANPNPAIGNQEFDYTIVLKNAGNSTAYQIADMIDTLPPDIKYVSDVSITPNGAATAGVYTPGANGFGGTLTYGGIGGASNSLAPGASITFVYHAKVQPQPQSGAVDTNDAAIQTYVSQPTGPTKTYGPVDGKNNVTIGAGQIAKNGTIHAPQVNDTNGKALTVGDQVDYTLTFLLPPNQVFPDGKITDCLPTGFRYVPGSYSATVSRPLPGPGTLPANDTAGFSTAAGSGNCPANRDLVTVGFGEQDNTGAPLTITVKLSATITATDRNGVPQFTAVPSSQSEPNSAYAFAGNSPQGSATSPALTVNRPNLLLAKAVARPTTPTTAGAQFVDFLVSLTNNGGSPAYDIAPFVDTLDSGLHFVAAYTSDASCQTSTQVAGVTANGQVITIPVSSPLAANGAAYVCVRTTIGPPASASTIYKNGVTLGTGNGPKYYSAPSSFTNRASYTQDSNPMAQVKTPDVTVLKGEKSGRPSPDGKAVPGEQITFTLQFTIPAGTTLYKPSIVDSYDFSQPNPQFGDPRNTTSGGTNLSCTNGASGVFTFAVTNGHATYAFPGNLTAGAGDAVCTLQLDVKALNVKPANVATATLTNPNFQIAFNNNSGVPVPVVTSNSASVVLTEPNVAIAKTLTKNFGPDGRATFAITLTNATGPNVSTAYDVSVTDNLPVGLIYVVGTATTNGNAVNPRVQHGPPATDSNYRLNGNNLTLTADSIAPGASVTYTIVVVSDLAPPPGTKLTNTATETYYDLPSATNNNSNQMDVLSRRAYTGSASADVILPQTPMGGPHFIWSFVQYQDGHDCIYPNTTVPVFVRITDTLSDIMDYPQITFVKPGGGSATTVEFKKLVSGTRRDGIYEADVFLDQYSPAGAYQITQLYAFDKLGNQIRQDVNDPVSASSPLTVCGGTSTGGGGSCVGGPAPKFTAGSVAYPNGGMSVAPGGSVKLTVHLTSCPGIIDPSITYLNPDGSDGPHADFKLASGTLNDGDWTATVLVDQYGKAGTYKVKELRGFDLYNVVVLQSAHDPVDAIAANLNLNVVIGTPTITDISPDAGPVGAGTRVTITGTGFRQGATVMFGTTAGVDPEVLSGTTLTVTTPANLPSGQVVVVVTNPDSQSSSRAAAARTSSNSAGANVFTSVQAAVATKPAVPATTTPGGGTPIAAPIAHPAVVAPTVAAGTPTPTPIPQPARH